MAKHFGEKVSGGAGARKGPAIVAALIVIALACVGLGLALTQMGGSEDTNTAATESSSDDVTVSDDDQVSTEQVETSSSDLPFSIDGVSSDAEVVEVSEADATEAILSDEWTFGGDYARIGSFPLNAQTVFGSATDDPDDIYSYRAALLGSSGDVYIEDAQSSDTYYEPQDGTGTTSLVVWRSSLFTGLPTMGTDDWRLQAWDSESGEAIVLGTAEQLNGTSETPMLDGEIVPTANETHAFFASYVGSGESWAPTVLAYDLGVENQDPVVIGEGSYPAATEGGAYWAGSVVSTDAGTFYQSLNLWSTSGTEQIFSVSSDEGTWGITGVWASGDTVAVCLSSDDSSQGCYVGIWTDDLGTCVVWLHVPSVQVVGSLNGEWFVWGAGSQEQDAEMYAYGVQTGELELLGTCPGYSRPMIAQEDNTVMVPVSPEGGYGAVSFRVGSL